MKKRLAVILMITALCWMVISPIVNALGYDPERVVNRNSNSMEGDEDPWGVEQISLPPLYSKWAFAWYMNTFTLWFVISPIDTKVNRQDDNKQSDRGTEKTTETPSRGL